jgi:hypothetical protein
VKAVHVAPDPFDIVPSEVVRLLAAEDGRTFGYGYGPGWLLMFGSEHGDVTVRPGQWVIRHDDGTVTVQNEPPEEPTYCGRVIGAVGTANDTCFRGMSCANLRVKPWTSVGCPDARGAGSEPTGEEQR